MQKHEETLNVKAVEKYQATEAEQAASFDTAAVNTVASDSLVLSSEKPRGLAHASEPEPVQNRSAPLPAPAVASSQRPGTIMITEHQTDALAPSPLVRALLTPPPNYLAPVRLLHHHLCKLLCPIQYRQYLPPRPDSVLWLDTLIFVILSLLTVLLLSKLARSWTRIVYAVFQALERISGLDMSWITQRVSPNRLPNHPYGQYWASGGTATGAGLHADRTRLRNMDTAMRARDIIKRFGRAPQADGAPLHVPAHEPRANGGT
jgi:hypothetical protein